MWKLWPASTILVLWVGCSPSGDFPTAALPQPVEIIDLGALVTEDLPQRFWGRKFLADRGWEDGNTFEVLRSQAGPVTVSNSYFRLFNHGGPHVDAPTHIGLSGGIDSYPVESFTGPLRVLDVSDRPAGRSVTRSFLESQSLGPGDVVLIYTGYRPPQTDQDSPTTTTLTREGALYLAQLPIRAFATDSFSVAAIPDGGHAESSGVGEPVPVHHTFLSRGIPVYEQLTNVRVLLEKQNMYFAGVPLNIRGGDGMMVRPLVFVY